MRRLNIFLILLVLVAILPIVSAQTYKLNQQIDLKVPCSIVDCTSPLNITISYPNSTTIVDNQPMTINSGYASYNFTFTSSIGPYQYSIYPSNLSSQTFDITTTGTTITTQYISVYIFALLLLLLVFIFSARLTINNSMAKDEMDSNKMYETKKRSEIEFYLNLMKKKMWIVGVFGIYITTLAFLALLSQLVYNLAMLDMTSILNALVQVLAWGTIPFCIFWFVYILLFFVKSTKDIMQHQYGGFSRK